jgi:beta-N-acetylhexosaminidase
MKPLYFPLKVVVFLFISVSCSSEFRTMRDDYRPTVFRTGDELARYMNSNPMWVERTLSRLSIEEKIGQMIVPRVYAHYLSADSREYLEIVRHVESLKVGGLVFFQGDVSEMAVIANDMQGRADIPLLISADFEWGTAMRMRRGTLFPVAMAIGATRDPVLAFRAGNAIAREARAVGVHQNFGPVADVNTNPANPVINVRSFGEETHLVKLLAKAYMDGLHAGGVISTAKHFPGHGDTDVDSHLDLPFLLFDEVRLESIELAPFKYLIDHGVMSIMSAHIAVPGLGEEERRPATLSRTIMTDLLRSEIGFEGLIVTDALEMRAITRNYSPDESAVMAVEAGADMILLSPDIELAFNTLLDAVRSGRISEERIDRSVRRILNMKYWAGLHNERFVDIPGYRSVIANDRHRELAKEIAGKSITLVRNIGSVLPLTKHPDRNLLVVIIADRINQQVPVTRPRAPAPTEPAGDFFVQQLRTYVDKVEVIRIDPRSNEIEFEALLEKVNRSDIVIGAAYVQARSHQGDIAIPDPMREALVAATKSATPFILVSFGDPYFIQNMPDVDAYMCAYSSAEASIEAAVESIVGVRNPGGMLPVTIPGIAPFGAGLIYTEMPVIRERLNQDDDEVTGINID